MKKIDRLKSWLQLEDAAEYLSTELGEPIAVTDIFQLAVERHLPISWYVRHVTARRVSPYTALFGRGYGPECNQLFTEEDKSSDSLKILQSWITLDGEDAVAYLDGLYRLELDYCGALEDWVLSQLTNTGGELISLNGLFVSSSDGTFWQIVEYNPGLGSKDPGDSTKKLKPFYYPSIEFPDEAELVVQRKDIDQLVRALLEPDVKNEKYLSQKSETTYLHIIGALLDVVSRGIPDGERSGSNIGPAENFSSEGKLIQAVAGRYQGFSGMSERNLQKKFALAKKKLSSY